MTVPAETESVLPAPPTKGSPMKLRPSVQKQLDSNPRNLTDAERIRRLELFEDIQTDRNQIELLAALRARVAVQVSA